MKTHKVYENYNSVDNRQIPVICGQFDPFPLKQETHRGSVFALCLGTTDEWCMMLTGKTHLIFIYYIGCSLYFWFGEICGPVCLSLGV